MQKINNNKHKNKHILMKYKGKQMKKKGGKRRKDKNKLMKIENLKKD